MNDDDEKYLTTVVSTCNARGFCTAHVHLLEYSKMWFTMESQLLLLQGTESGLSRANHLWQQGSVPVFIAYESRLPPF